MYHVYTSESLDTDQIDIRDHCDRIGQVVAAVKCLRNKFPRVTVTRDCLGGIGEVEQLVIENGEVISTGEGTFNVFYDTPEGTERWCLNNMKFPIAVAALERFKAQYIDPETGEGKAWPNGKGKHDIRNPRVGCVDCLQGKVGQEVTVSTLQ